MTLYGTCLGQKINLFFVALLQLAAYKPDVNITGTFDSYLLAGTLAGLGVLLGSMALYGVDLYVRTEANKGYHQ